MKTYYCSVCKAKIIEGINCNLTGCKHHPVGKHKDKFLKEFLGDIKNVKRSK